MSEESHQQLMRFYGVRTIDELIEAQERHIEKLQETVRRLQPAQRIDTRVREG